MIKHKQKKTYPMLYVKHWWALRIKFKQSIPGIVTDNYLATVLNIKVVSARANVLPFLKDLGIIDIEGKTGDRATKWRDDKYYVDVCKEILKEVYPDELLKAVPDPEKNRDEAERWFSTETSAGKAAVQRMAALYVVIAKADASQQFDQVEKKVVEKKKQKKNSAEPLKVKSETLKSDNSGKDFPKDPGININLEIHISADATSDQIDQIFLSMAKHIYKRG